MKNILAITLLLTFSAQAAAQQATRLPTADKALAGAPTQQFAIGAEDGEDWELLSRVSGVAFDAADNLYVLDAGNHRVLVFNANGKFVRKIGKKGGGPGELLSPIGLALTKDGHVAVTDLGRSGVSLFKPDGSFVKNVMLGEDVGLPAIQGGTMAHPTRGIVVRGSGARMFRGGNGGPPSPGPSGPRQAPIVWYDAAGKATTLHNITLPSITPKVTNEGGSGGRQNFSVRMSPPAFLPPVLWTMLPNGTVAVADETNYRVKLVRNGKTVGAIERPFAPRAVTERDKEKARQLRRTAMKTGAGMVVAMRNEGPGGGSSSISTGGPARVPDSEIEEQIREMTFLDVVPALQKMNVDAKGRLWIERTGRDVGSAGPIDIIDPAGRYIGTLNGRMPDAFSRSGKAAYIEKDDMDVEKVVVRRLPAGWL